MLLIAAVAAGVESMREQTDKEPGLIPIDRFRENTPLVGRSTGSEGVAVETEDPSTYRRAR